MPPLVGILTKYLLVGKLNMNNTLFSWPELYWHFKIVWNLVPFKNVWKLWGNKTFKKFKEYLIW